MRTDQKLARLRKAMQEKGMDAYIIPSADYHQSEYVGDFFKARAYVTGFTGSAGVAVITMDDAGLWTDGRYFIQAETQLEGSGITLYKIGNDGVPTTLEYLEKAVPQNGCIGFDGRLMAMQEGTDILKTLSHKNIRVAYELDLVDVIWHNRPKMPCEPVFMLEEKYSGESAGSKLSRVRSAMKEAGATHHVITTLDDVAWLLNIRGNDVEYSPLVLCYAIVTMEKTQLFIEEGKLSAHDKQALVEDGVVFLPYNAIYEEVKRFAARDAVLLDPLRINYALYNNLPAHTKKIEAQNPTILFKAIKNSVELKNIENAHIKDGVANTKLMHWLKTNIGGIRITEISVAEKLEAFRKEQQGYLWQSFSPICAFREHAAMMHYSATPETDAELHEGHLFLMDTGGNYYEGSTDITRTIALGEISPELKTHFTAVARGMMNLARARFLYGCKGFNLDILARAPIWELGIDYKCGTGHGIGYLLNIHEGPAGFRWAVRPNQPETATLEEGMVITDEPGIYIEGSHGIRLENELIIRKGEANAFGQFMYMDTVTFVPIDLDAIDPALLNEDEKGFLNSYHQQVYAKIAPFLSHEERIWLKEYTRPLS